MKVIKNLIFSGQQITSEIKPVNVSRDALKQLKDVLENEKGGNNE